MFGRKLSHEDLWCTRREGQLPLSLNKKMFSEAFCVMEIGFFPIIQPSIQLTFLHWSMLESEVERLLLMEEEVLHAFMHACEVEVAR